MSYQIEEKKKTSKRKIKCVVWDLDHTIWNGILMEDASVELRGDIVHVIKTLDERGILQSIASRNEHEVAMAKLQELGIDEYFIYPQINWNRKSASIKTIVESINIGMDTIAFIDDQPFEREEVSFNHPDVLCIDAIETDKLLDLPEFNPTFVTEDSRNRRRLYMSDIVRNEEESSFEGSQEEFLASLGMVFTVSPVEGDDLKRAEELTVRTHQLNATGYTYSYEELDAFRHSSDHLLLISDLEDKYGDYGKIGLTLLERNGSIWTLKLLLMSCRVMSRGVGSIMLNYVAKLAHEANAVLRAEFVPTDRNRMMLLTYKFAGFKEIEHNEGLIIFEHDPAYIQSVPDYVTLISRV
ncbi:HAD-IIIC family phosphatase [Paenibacillus sp. GCM10012307]|uniref:HAD-IIIC family phosphatase n=1 Tax=Paenibacillus roseus TaxID=2798579 RepID=A0A934MTC4_9BACL|nr:HAD-IIIC family phosphatase [Paenibacillus roseus]MBJ6364089.1 HAD-IIIC family phosphatase [Paenibacillus roseus]